MTPAEGDHVDEDVAAVLERARQGALDLAVEGEGADVVAPGVVAATATGGRGHLPAVRGQSPHRGPADLSRRAQHECPSSAHTGNATAAPAAGTGTSARSRFPAQRERRGNFLDSSACVAFALTAYSSTYSWPERLRMAYMISSVTARIAAFWSSRPA